MRCSLLLTAALSIVTILPQTATAQADSLVDVFPLVEGAQWTYSWHDSVVDRYRPIFIDTGTVEYTVSHKIVTADSIRWFLWQRRSLRKGPPGYNYAGAWSDIADSRFVEVVEKLEGRHQLFRTPEPSPSYPVDPLTFYRTYYLWGYYFQEDTGKVYRYNRVNKDGRFFQEIACAPIGGSRFLYGFRRGVGIESLWQEGHNTGVW